MKAKMFRALLPFAIVFTLISCSSDSSEDTVTPIVESFSYNETELDLMNKINNHRESVGLNPLEKINHISYKSSEHNDYMIENDVVGHQYFDQRASNIKQVLGAVQVSENVAYNYQSNEGVLHAWLMSDGHKDNIEGDFTHFGISVKTNPNTGKKYYTNIFMKR
ncbi:MAG TPA: CAP domain-containing protein [Flavobacterium sp.]|uniref:CAP domain-containing protein n=1 Tax=unclassified Flavobacterium TaxID=196869 RepID=UPI000E8D3C82|nr:MULTISPECIES: CAP domain-containing protein [unclassified Flavobacterium]HBI00213.1 CAP domain-containing protein [Flavobacterium sp.]HRE77179.1 CAP domain-containing protein [Flavobacterium sp.]